MMFKIICVVSRKASPVKYFSLLLFLLFPFSGIDFTFSCPVNNDGVARLKQMHIEACMPA